ncbi:hypothetical protein B7494_g588 [Chlorociboria aeruginascens]|nr:hypothetical protein B7494_g588 [Chlorociboria aeruginascens]
MAIVESAEVGSFDLSRSTFTSTSSEFDYSESVMKVRRGEKPNPVYSPPPTFYPSSDTQIMCGGFAPAPEPQPRAPTPPPAPDTCADTRRDFPPHPNAVYNLDTHGRDPKYIGKFESTLEGTAIVLDSIRNGHEGAFDGAASTPKKTGPTPGEILAKTINFNRLSSVRTAPGVSGEIYSAKEQREDFIKAINEGVPLEFCRKCEEKHIPPGSPITLQDRDTCGSYLPDARNKEFHDYHPKWQAVGRRGGWWKCKKTLDAPAVERNCKVCHREEEEDEDKVEVAEEQKIDMMRVRKKNIEDYIEKQVKAQGARDRASVEELWRKERILKKYSIKEGDEVRGASNRKGKEKEVRIGDDNSSSEEVGSGASTTVGTSSSDADLRALLQKVWDGDD